MNKTQLSICLALALLVIFLTIAFFTSDLVNSNLMTALVIITGAFMNHQFSKSKVQ